jgi:hypothetical protein
MTPILLVPKLPTFRPIGPAVTLITPRLARRRLYPFRFRSFFHPRHWRPFRRPLLLPLIPIYLLHGIRVTSVILAHVPRHPVMMMTPCVLPRLIRPFSRCLSLTPSRTRTRTFLVAWDTTCDGLFLHPLWGANADTPTPRQCRPPRSYLLRSLHSPTTSSLGLHHSLPHQLVLCVPGSNRHLLSSPHHLLFRRLVCQFHNVGSTNLFQTDLFLRLSPRLRPLL